MFIIRKITQRKNITLYQRWDRSHASLVYKIVGLIRITPKTTEPIMVSHFLEEALDNRLLHFSKNNTFVRNRKKNSSNPSKNIFRYSRFVFRMEFWNWYWSNLMHIVTILSRAIINIRVTMQQFAELMYFQALTIKLFSYPFHRCYHDWCALSPIHWIFKWHIYQIWFVNKITLVCLFNLSQIYWFDLF